MQKLPSFFKRLHLSRNGLINSNGQFDWDDALADAGILFGLAFVTSLIGISIAAPFVEIVNRLCAAAIAGGVQFFSFLCIKRGLIKKP